MGEGASFALGAPRPLAHGGGGLIRFGTTKAPTAGATGPPFLSPHRGSHRMGQGASLVSGPSRPPPHGRGGLLGFGIGFTRIGEEERRDGEAIALHKTHILCSAS